MRILYLTDQYLDYLNDEVLHGLRFLVGENIVDFAKKEILYIDSKRKISTTMVGGTGRRLLVCWISPLIAMITAAASRKSVDMTWQKTHCPPLRLCFVKTARCISR
jgi:hypothetical protein